MPIPTFLVPMRCEFYSTGARKVALNKMIASLFVFVLILALAPKLVAILVPLLALYIQLFHKKP